MNRTKLFESLDDLKPFIFRITDNGGQTADRYTVVTCDGDFWTMSYNPFHPQGVGLTGENLDPLYLSERVEAGIERDIRWIDLPEACQRCVMDGLNQGFADYVEEAPAADNRDEALNFEGWSDYLRQSRERALKNLPRVEAVYRDGDAYRLRMDDRMEIDGEDPGPFAAYREAVLHMLPEDYDLSGPEFHTTIDMWDETGGPAAEWDRTLEPPMMAEALPFATVMLTGPAGATIGYFETEDDAYAHIDRIERERAEAEPDRTFVRAAYAVRPIPGKES